MAPRAVPRPSGTGRPIPFHTTKYGPELLVDVAWVHEMATFIVDRPHRLAFHDIALITRGRGTLMIDGVRHPIRPGSIVFTAPGQIREWRVSGLEAICLFFPALFLDEFLADRHFIERLGYFSPGRTRSVVQLGPSRARALRRRLAQMRGELRRLQGDSVHLLRARAYEVLITLSRDYAERPAKQAQLRPELRTQRFLQLVERDHVTADGVAHYARELAVTPGYLSTLCRRHLGRSAKQVIADRVLLEARRRLLYSDETIDRIGRALGFKDASYFSRFFRRQAGMAPRQFRSTSITSS